MSILPFVSNKLSAHYQKQGREDLVWKQKQSDYMASRARLPALASYRSKEQGWFIDFLRPLAKKPESLFAEIFELHEDKVRGKIDSISAEKIFYNSESLQRMDLEQQDKCLQTIKMVNITYREGILQKGVEKVQII